jgi:hypothetical protein
MSDSLGRFTRRLITALWVVSGGALAVLSAFEVRDIWVVPPTPPEVSHDLIVKHARDSAGRRASFRILLFSDEFRWRLASVDAIEESATLPAFTDEMKAVLNSAEEIICVGTSSEELPPGLPFNQGRAQEERRAARRAEQIARWVRGALWKPIAVRKLNVGHHAPTGAAGDVTSDQRRIVIILVLDHDQGTDIDQSLRAAMAAEASRAPIFETLLTNYSLATEERFTWVP